MKRFYGKRLLPALIILPAFWFCLPAPAGAYWIWTPETKKWVNPVYSVKESAPEQLDWAMSFYNAKDYRGAVREFRKLLRYYKDTAPGGEAQYFLAMSYRQLGNFNRAFDEYKKLAADFPASGRINEAIAAEFGLGEIFLGKEFERDGKKETIYKPAKAAEIFKEVRNQAPFGEFGDRAQFNLAAALMKTKRFREAKDELERLIGEYPESALLPDARFQLAVCWEKLSPGAAYAQDQTRKAAAEYAEASKSTTDPGRVEAAQRALKDLEEKQAESAFNVARFYEIQGKKPAAMLYYQEIVNKYPGSRWAERARERLTALEVK